MPSPLFLTKERYESNCNHIRCRCDPMGCTEHAKIKQKELTMQVKELMQYDWVHYNCPTSFPDLDEQVINFVYSEQQGYFIETETLQVPIKLFSPIYITEDILKANGFSNRNESGWQNPKQHLTMWLYCNTFAHGIPFVDRYIDMIHNIRFVHELQHALRLCGLSDFADSFKIK